MSGHPVKIEDRERVRCQGPHINEPCGARATWCEYGCFARHSRGGSTGISFWYFCDAHGPRVRVLNAACRKREGMPDPDGPLARWDGLYRRFNAASRRWASGLIRLAAAVEAVPRQEGSDAADAVWRHIRWSADGRAVTWAQRVFREAYLPTNADLHPKRLPSWLRPARDEQEPDPRPGRYVTAIDGDTPHFVAGPYATHHEALALVGAVREHARRRDRRGDTMAWGTARTAPDAPALTTILGAWPEIDDTPPSMRPTR